MNKICYIFFLGSILVLKYEFVLFWDDIFKCVCNVIRLNYFFEKLISEKII